MTEITQALTLVNFTPGNDGRKFIVLHYTANRTDTAAANANYFRTVNRGASAHYFVDRTSIYQVVADANTAWAVGKNYGIKNLFGFCTNANSLSIEMCSNDGEIAPETVQNAVDLTLMLMEKYDIPVERVVRHYDVCTKPCPGWEGWIPPDEHLWEDFKLRLQVQSEPEPEPDPEGGEGMQGLILNNGKIYYYNIETKNMWWVPNPGCLTLLKEEYKRAYGKDIQYMDASKFETLKKLVKGKSV